MTVEPGTAHQFWNATDASVRFRCEITPALQFEQLIETMFALANDGKTTKKGLPNPLQLAVIASHHFDDVRLPFPPVWMQKLGLMAGAPTRTPSRLPPGLRPGRRGRRLARDLTGSSAWGGLPPTSPRAAGNPSSYASA